MQVYLAEVLQMTICVPAGSGNLHYSVALSKGHGCRRTNWVSGMTVKRSTQKEVSWYVFVLQNCFYYSINTAHKLIA